MKLNRQELTRRVLADWHKFRTTRLKDPNERDRCYAEMTGYFASVDPIAFSEFVATQRRMKR